MSDHELWNEVGNLYFKSGAYELAKNAYAHAIDLEHEFGKPYANLGVANARQEKYADAIALYRKALELLNDPFDKAFTWYKLGNAYWDVEDYSLAMEAFHKADELLPSQGRDLVASPEMLLTSRRGVDEVLTILDLPEEDVPTVEPTSFIASASDFGRDAYLDDLSPWKFNESILTGEEPAIPESEWMPLDETEESEPSEAVIEVAPLKCEASTETESTDETTVAETEAVATEEVEASINFPDEFVQEFALENAVTTETSEMESIAPEIESPVAVVEESEAIPFPVTIDEPALMNDEEPRMVILESHLVEVESAEIETVEVIASVEETPVTAEVNEIPEEVPTVEIENHPMIVVADESETAQFVEEVNEAVMSEIALALVAEVNEEEVPAEVAEPVEMEVQALPVMEIQPESEVVTEAPEFVAENVTDSEPIHYEAPTLDVPMDDSFGIWKEINRVKRVLEINPQNAQAWDSLGGLYKSLGQYQQAIDAFQEAVSLEPTKAIYVQRLALAFAGDGRMDKAATTFEKAIELNPENSLAHATLGAYYRRQGRDDLASAHIEKARGLLDDEENEYNRACLEAICGNSDRALDLLEIALKNKQTYATWVRRDPDLDFIRNDARFEALLVEYEMEPAQ